MAVQPDKPGRISEAPATTPQPARTAAMLPVIIIGGVLVGVIALGVYFFVHRSTNAEEPKPEAKAPPDTKKSKMIKFQPMTVNMRGSPRRFLRVALGMETTYQKVVEELEKPSPQVADFLIDKLSNVDTSDVDTTTGRNKLKREILAGVNETLQLLEVEGYVSNVYFVEFVIQSQ